MFVPKLTLPLLLSVLSSAKGGRDTHIRPADLDIEEERLLSHYDEPAWEKLVATIGDKHRSLDSVQGSIMLSFGDEGTDFNLSYHVYNLPAFCEKCYIAVMDQDNCDGDLDADLHYFDGGRRRLYHSEEEEEDTGMTDPFTQELTKFITDEHGDATGGITGIDNGYSKSGNRCKIAVIWDEVEEVVEHSTSYKSPKSDKRKLVRALGKQTGRRAHTVTEKVMRVIGCGVLKKKGMHDDCE